jgi:predicted phage tail protein
MRKIYLEGQLGQKFGSSHLFCGDTPAEAFRLIGTNYPEFRKYLIECHENDIGFHVEVNNQEVDVLECLMPLSQGDIIVTPVPSGSKSGGGKILTAIAIAALFFLPGGPQLGLNFGQLVTTGASATSAGVTSAAVTVNTAGLIAGSLAVNLALTGMSQLMAPDPATDQQNEEGYLFTGDARNVVEGDPVPLLYGELRVPGLPISVEVLPNTTAANNYANHSGNYMNDTDYLLQEAAEMMAMWEMQQLNGQDTSSLSINSNSIYGRSQNILVTNVISEGPIEGLVNGASSVYLNNDPAIDPVDSNSGVGATASFTNSSTSGTASNTGASNKTSTEDNTTAYIKIRDYKTGTAAVNYQSTFVDEYYAQSELQIVSTTSVFTSSMVEDPNKPLNTTVRLMSSGGAVLFESKISQYISGTTVTLGYGGLPLSLTNGASYTFVIDKAEEGSIDENDNIDLTNPFDGASGDYPIVTGGTQETLDSGDNLFTAAKYKNFGVQFRTGHLYQEPLKSMNGSGDYGNTSITTSLNNPIVGPGNTGTNSYTYNTSTLGLSAVQAAEADEVRFLISYSSLVNFDEENGERLGKAWYKIEVRFTNDGTNFLDWKVINEAKKHVGTYTTTFTFDEYINLEQHRPAGATDWEVRITRLTDNDVAYENERTRINSNYTSQTPATIVSATTTIKEPLSYPLTAVSRVQFNSQDFNNLPSITHLCRGMKVKVPSNYVTREESSDGVASYKRSTSTGAIETSYQNWDGNFRAEKIYTNNPAWIFYDILINNRYGLGSYLAETDIDKYALYRIARYADELVDDGNGGLEPRFTTNVWITKSTDAYKILKDLATVFRGMLYWIDGELVSIIDQASDAVYNFSSSNVIDGSFAYESSGSKTRANQVGVTWNNPLSDFKPETLLIEDGQDIAKTGKIIRDSAVAFGATSEGQALRYGRWKLWTSKNQTEIVSFATAINAAFLRPGDIINVQDPYRHPPYQTLSGRISSSGTRTSSIIPLDREITLQADSTYELNVLIEEPGAFLSQDSATIGGTLYTVGELIPTISNEADASDIVDSVTGDPVQAVWKKYTRVETQTVSTSAGSGITSLTVSTAFSTTPNAQTVWALRRALTVSEAEVIGTKQEYKILALSQNDDTTYNITAVKHYNEKFNAVDSNWTLSVEDPVYPAELADDIVPPPGNVYLVPEALDSDSIANDVTVHWDTPLNSDGTTYNKVAKYELSHNLSEVKQNPIYLPAQFNTVGPYEFPIGTSTVSIATVSTSGKKSKPKKAFITISEPIKEKNVPRLKKVPRGGVSNSPISLNASNEFQFSKTDYTFTPIGNSSIEVLGVSGTASTYSHDVSNIPAISDATWAAYTLQQKLYAAHFILIDSSNTTDPIKLIKWYDDTTLNIGYWYDTGTGSTAVSSYWGTATGNININANSNKVTGSGTTFTSDFEVEDYIKIGSNTVAKISYIASNTVMYLDRSFTSAISSATAYYPTLRIDKNNDAIIAGVRNLQTGGFKLVISPNFTVVADPEVYQGQDGVDGVDGVNGLDRQTGFVYYTIAQNTQPSGPGQGTYTWATDIISGMNSNWSQTPPTQEPGSSGKYWYASYNVSKTDPSDTSNSITFGSVFLGTNFEGLVTFSSGDFLLNGSSITTIDGGNIDTDTIVVDSITSSNWQRSLASGATQRFRLGTGTAFNIPALGTINSSVIGWGLSNGSDIVVGNTGLSSSGPGVFGGAYSAGAASYGGVFGHTDDQSFLADGVTPAFADWHNIVLLSGHTNTQAGYFEGSEYSGGSKTTYNITKIGTSSNAIEISGTATSCGIITTGNITAYGTASDIRLKDNIEVIPDALEKVSELRGVTFDYKSDGKRNTGLIAQELQKVLPEAVYETSLPDENEEDKVLAIRYGNVVGLLVEAIKELKAEIQELKK